MWANLESLKYERKTDIDGKTYFISKCGYCPYYKVDTLSMEKDGFCCKRLFDLVRYNDIPNDECPLERRYSI